MVNWPTVPVRDNLLTVERRRTDDWKRNEIIHQFGGRLDKTQLKEHLLETYE